MLLWVLLAVFVVYFYVRAIKPHNHWRDRNIVHKKPWPIVGNMGQIVFRVKSFPEVLVDIYKEFNLRYFGFYQFLAPSMLLKDLDLIKQIAIKDFDSFLDHRDFISEEIDPLFGKNLFSLKGQKWRNMRSTLSPAFTGSKMRAMYILISETAEQFTTYFKTQSESVPDKTLSVEMKDVLTRFANDVIATTAFGIQVDSLKEKDNEFYVMGKAATNFTGLRGLKFFGYTVSPMLMRFFKVKIFNDKVCEFFRNLVKTTMATREAMGIVRPDMIHLLMEAKKGNLKHEEKKEKDDAGFATVEESQVGKQNSEYTQEWTDDDLTAQVILFFLAGFDSISGGMCHLANELALHPDIQTRLQAEIDEAFEEGHGKIQYETLIKLKYLDMVVSENLRKWPAAIMTDRRCNASYTVEPVNSEERPLHLVKGDIVWIPIYAIHRDPNHFPDPDKFDPERFNDENKGSIKPLSYIPFGLGPRNCIGSRFALLEIKTVFAHILRKFDIVVTKKTEIPLQMDKTAFNLNAKNGFWLGLKPRDL